MHHSINIAAAWGFVSIGTGYAYMKEVLSTLNIPSQDKIFSKIENDIGGQWEEAIAFDMVEAGRKRGSLQ